MAMPEASGERINTRSKESLRLWLKFLGCENRVKQYLRIRLKDRFGITLPQFDVLAKLDHVNEAMTLTELSKQLMVSNGNVTGVVDRLVREGFVDRNPSTEDRRVQLIQLTDKGKQTFNMMADDHETWIASLFEYLSIEEIHQMSALLNKTASSIKTKSGERWK